MRNRAAAPCLFILAVLACAALTRHPRASGAGPWLYVTSGARKLTRAYVTNLDSSCRKLLQYSKTRHKTYSLKADSISRWFRVGHAKHRPGMIARIAVSSPPFIYSCVHQGVSRIQNKIYIWPEAVMLSLGPSSNSIQQSS